MCQRHQAVSSHHLFGDDNPMKLAHGRGLVTDRDAAAVRVDASYCTRSLSNTSDEPDMEVPLDELPEISLEDFHKSVEVVENIHSIAARVNITSLQASGPDQRRARADQLASQVWNVTEWRFM